jgi:hypothetical protein
MAVPMKGLRFTGSCLVGVPALLMPTSVNLVWRCGCDRRAGSG